MTDPSSHWNDVYERRAPDEVSWYQPEASLSLSLIGRTGVPRDAPLLDVGAGASTLVDSLLAQGYRDITLLDVAESAFEPTRRRLNGIVSAAVVKYVTADITTWKPAQSFALWHDRAVFHFLTEAHDRAAYRDALASGLEAGGHVIIATFALDGPERCSGLPVQRYSSASLAAEFDGVLRLVEEAHEVHHTPSGNTQSFVFAHFVRR